MNNILIYIELTDKKEIRPVSLQLVSKANFLKERLSDSNIIACIIDAEINYDKIIEKLSQYGTDKIIIAKDSKFYEYNNSYHPEILYRIAQKYVPSIILIGATIQGKEIASYVSTKFETGLTADCTDLNITEAEKLISTRPTFGGQLTADILCKTIPQMATVQENIFILTENKSTPEIIYENIDGNDIQVKIQTIKKEIKKNSTFDVCGAEIIVSGGAGACRDNGFELLKKLAGKINAAVAGSREAYEKGYITKSQQIGQTGKTVAPKLYIAVGISGASQHLTAIKNSGKIIAINKDANAPIFKHSDIGIIGDLFEILPELIKALD